MTDVLASFAAREIPQVDQVIHEYLQGKCQSTSLLKAMDYSIDAGGKRLRPLLLLATLAFFKQPITLGAYQVAAAIEMVHTYSLIHDDLPAMDDDDYRRGRLTNHKVFGEGIATLAGDALLTEAFHLLADSDLPDGLRLTLLSALASSCGSAGMIAGQVADLEAEHQIIDLPTLQSIHAKKTGALFEFSVLAAVQLADLAAGIDREMRDFAWHFGVAFQIKDDLLDVIGDATAIGKATGMDASRGKNTYPSLLGVDGAQAALVEHCQRALACLAASKRIYASTTDDKYLQAIVATLEK